MSGHSKWASIKHKKGLIDAKRGKIFSKLIKEITVAAKIGGGVPENNARLKVAIDRAKASNMPNKNIDAAIKRGAGTDESADYQEIVYEGYGPSGVGIIISCLTDNKNRTVADVRSTLTKNGGNLGETNSVSWQFEKKGVISIEKKAAPDEEKMMEICLECGAEDIITEEEGYTVKTEPADFAEVLKKIKEQNIEIAESEITYVAKTTVPVPAETVQKVDKIVELLEDLDDVQSVSTNEST